MNMGIILSLVAALALFCAAPNSMTAVQSLVFGGPAAYAGEADAPAAESTAQAGFFTSPVTIKAGAAGDPCSHYVPRAPKHPLIIDWWGGPTQVPHDSDRCAFALECALMNGKEFPVPDEECRVVMVHILKILHTRVPPPPPKVQAKGGLIEMPVHHRLLYLNVGQQTLRMPNMECAALVLEALKQNETVPAPDDRCRALMLRALEIQRKAPPVSEGHAKLLPPARPPLNDYVDVGGMHMPVPTQCAAVVEKALEVNDMVPSADHRCRVYMREALKLQRNAPTEGEGSPGTGPLTPRSNLLRNVPIDPPNGD